MEKTIKELREEVERCYEVVGKYSGMLAAAVVGDGGGVGGGVGERGIGKGIIGVGMGVGLEEKKLE